MFWRIHKPSSVPFSNPWPTESGHNKEVSCATKFGMGCYTAINNCKNKKMDMQGIIYLLSGTLCCHNKKLPN